MLNEALTTEYIDPVEEEPEILDFAQASSLIDTHILVGCHGKEWRSIVFWHQIENVLKHQQQFMELTVKNEKLLMNKIDEQVKLKIN